MKRISADVAVIGAGPAGLCAALEAAKAGAKVLLIDENARPGGQLFKQIHKFFGSREHEAGVRGFQIGESLLAEVREAGVNVMLDSLAYGIFPGEGIGLIHEGKHYLVEASRTVIAAGAKENYIAFPGSTLPGVMGAGAAQTMINIHRVLPGRKVLMLGSGNVGLIVSYQLLQAGAEVAAVVEAAPRITGYRVHAAKLMRAGVPFYTGYTIRNIFGSGSVEGAVITALDDAGKAVEGSEKQIDCDTVCLAVGLNPMTELVWQAGCAFDYIPALGGHVPLHDENLETTVPGVYVAGDVTGVEEASSAMDEGRLAGIACAEALGFLPAAEAERRKESIRQRLTVLRSGPFGEKRRTAKEKLAADMEKVRAEKEAACPADAEQ